MNLSKFFIDRPIFAGVLSLLIFLGGLIAVRGLPISEYPEVVPPSIVVRANYPGANPKVIAETVATPIEEQINGVEGMLYMSSQATTDGLMTLTVSFKLGTDPDKAQQLVQNRVSQAEARLPEEVKRLGVTTAIDDFGTGYSSLSYLKLLPINNLKIDRAFVNDLPRNDNDIAITRAIVALGHSLGFEVTAEGIENEAQRDFLTELGCQFGQGYLFGRPMPEAEFEQWLTAHSERTPHILP